MVAGCGAGTAMGMRVHRGLDAHTNARVWEKRWPREDRVSARGALWVWPGFVLTPTSSYLRNVP
jgi:hypothetical protein